MAKLSRQYFECMPQQLAGPLMRTVIPWRPRLLARAREFSLPPRTRTGVEISSAAGAVSGCIGSSCRLSARTVDVGENEHSGMIGEEMLEKDLGDGRAVPGFSDEVMMV